MQSVFILGGCRRCCANGIKCSICAFGVLGRVLEAGKFWYGDGGILNMVLDPIFISLFGLEISGAAIATMLSNLVATIYFVVLIIKRKKTTVLTLNPCYYTVGMHIPVEVLLVGFPSCIMKIRGYFPIFV